MSAHFRQFLPGIVLCLLAIPCTADEITLGSDGWYRWEVAAGAGGRHACCYRFRSGNIQNMGCKLGNGANEFGLDKPCQLDSDTMQIFVEVREGQVREIRPLSSDCPVRTGADVQTLENISPADSIAWLLSQAERHPHIMDEAVMTISFHREAEALPTLFGLLKDREITHDTREQALFWLIQTDADEAYAYIDRLLD